MSTKPFEFWILNFEFWIIFSGNHFNPDKKLTQKLFLDFLNVPNDENNAKRQRDGVDNHYQFNITFPANIDINPNINENQTQAKTIIKTIDIILLDIRSHWGWK